MLFPAFGRGGGAFQWWGGLDGRVGTGFCAKYFGCCNYFMMFFARHLLAGGTFVFFRTGADVSPLQAVGIIPVFHRKAGLNKIRF